MMYRLFLIVACCLGTAQSILSQHQFSLELDKLAKPQTIQFGYWYIGTPYLLDSAKVDPTQPIARFNVKKNLDPGLYFFNLSDQKAVLEFVLNQEAALDFRTSSEGWIDSFSVKKSIENEPFFLWRAAKMDKERRIAHVRSMIEMLQRAGRETRDATNEQYVKVRELRAEIDALTRRQLLLYPNLLFAQIINAELPGEVPASIEPITAEGNVNPEYMQYFRDHFWDPYDFKDTRLLRSPVMARKADGWLQVQPKEIDSIQAGLDRLVARAAVNKKSRQELVGQLLQRFDQPSYGGNETMFTYLFDKHIPTATSMGVDTATWMRGQYKANAYRATLPGRIAPQIQLPDTTGTLQSLLDFKAKYTLLFFFNPKCGHCVELTPQVYALTQQYASTGARVFAVSTETKEDYWKEYVRKNVPAWTCVADFNERSTLEKLYATHQLPNLLVLDEQKKILIRRLPVADLERLLKGLR